MEQHPRHENAILSEAVPALVSDYEDARSLVPRGEQEANVLSALATLVSDSKPATAELLMAERGRIAPETTVSMQWAAKAALEDVRAGPSAPWCDDVRDVCVANTVRLTQQLVSRAPTDCVGYRMLIEMMLEQGNAEGARTEITSALQNVPDRMECLADLESAIRRDGHDELIKDLLDVASQSPCSTDSECIDQFMWIGATEENDGHYAQALAFYRKALERDPNQSTILDHIASTASTLGLHGEAYNTYTKLCDMQPSNPRWCERRERERMQAARPAVGTLP